MGRWVSSYPYLSVTLDNCLSHWYREKKPFTASGSAVSPCTLPKNMHHLFRDSRVCVSGGTQSALTEAASSSLYVCLEHGMDCHVIACSPERTGFSPHFRQKVSSLQKCWEWYLLTYRLFRPASLYHQNLEAYKVAACPCKRLSLLCMAPICLTSTDFHIRTHH